MAFSSSSNVHSRARASATRAGHGTGKPTSKIIEETADQWAFLFKNLGMKLPF